MNMRDQLAEEVRQWTSIGIPALMQRYLLAAGQQCHAQPLPRRYKKGPPRACFHNAIKLVKRSRGKLRYVEGYARSTLGMLIHHGWAIDADYRVIDVTWSDPAACDYFGRVFTLEEWERETDRTNCQCVLDTGTGLNWPFMFDDVPGLKDQVHEARKKAPELLQIGGSEGPRDQA